MADRSTLASVAVCTLLLLSSVAQAQTPDTPGSQLSPPTVACAGQPIDSIEIDPGRPPFSGSAKKWQALARTLGLHHATTRAEAIRAYLLLNYGDPCVDARRSESERILRALPFIADASIRTVADTGGVRLIVTTVDEIPVLVAAALRGSYPSALTLGNANIGGLGLRVVGGAERLPSYRNGAHIQLVDYGLFDEPLTTLVDAAQDPLGSHVEFGISHPFLTDLQSGSWLADFRTADDYPEFLRPVGDNTSLEVRQDRWVLGGLGRTHLGSIVALLGGVVLGNRITPALSPVLVTDSGLKADPDTTLRGRYTTFRTTRVGALLGIRRIKYVTVNGFDALFAAQDLMKGVQAGALIAPGLGLRGYRDALIANTLYLGAASERSLLAAELETEGSRELSGNATSSMIGSMRAAWYYKFDRSFLLKVDDELSVADGSREPTQLTFSDPVGGVRGFGASPLAGGRRNVVRTELRWSKPKWIHQSDLGMALFADAGVLRAGDVAYGTNAFAQSVGFSLLGAYPTGSKRLYRLDVAFPLASAGVRGGHAIGIRFSSADPTSAFWTEPNDVQRSRLAPVPSSLFAWPTR